jgi:hypothetical protein
MAKVKYSKSELAHARYYHDVVDAKEAAKRIRIWLGSREFWRRRMQDKGIATTTQLTAYNRATRAMKKHMCILEIHLGRIPA